ncbi:MAG: alkaline phosphatase [Burkholderiaceae bacterium]
MSLNVRLAGLCSAGLLVAPFGHAQVLPHHQTQDAFYQQAQARMAAQMARTPFGSARNVILFIGDGMGISTLTAARILKGQLEGGSGEEYELSFEKFPYSAFSKTYSANQQTPDSAPTATAMVTGVKTNDGVLGLDSNAVRGECKSTFGNELVTALELAEIRGQSTGIVSTARITHATPAATYAKSVERDWEDISDMPDDAIADGCKDIADQLINFEDYLERRFENIDVNGIEVVMGGGRRHFLPKDAAFNSGDEVSAVEGDRTDGRNLVAEWQARYPDGVYVKDLAEFFAADASKVNRLFGLFNESHMQYMADNKNDRLGEPSLATMTGKAIDILSKNARGFFLMVEAGRIDHAHHAGNAYGALTDTIELARAVQAAVDKTKVEDTLIIVTADHSHVFTIAGYPKRGNPILGKVVQPGKSEPSLAADGLPYTTVGYNNGMGFRDLGSETDSDAGYEANGGLPDPGRKDLTGINTEAPGYHQETLVPLSSETHAGEDVSIHARGPGAHLVSGVMEQSAIFNVIQRATGLIAD